jgi:hypothetical protein
MKEAVRRIMWLIRYVLGQWKAPIDGRVRQLNYRANLERRIDCQQELIGITTFILSCFRFTGIKVSLLMDQLFASSSESCSSLKNRCVIDSDKSEFLFIGLEVKLSELFFLYLATSESLSFAHRPASGGAVTSVRCHVAKISNVY